MKTFHNFLLCLMAALVIITLAFGLDYLGTHSDVTPEGWVYAFLFVCAFGGFFASLITFNDKNLR